MKFSVVRVVDADWRVPVIESPVPVAPRNPRFAANKSVDVVFAPTAVVYASDVA